MNKGPYRPTTRVHNNVSMLQFHTYFIAKQHIQYHIPTCGLLQVLQQAIALPRHPRISVEITLPHSK